MSPINANAVRVYGPYAPSPGRSRWRVQIYDPSTLHKRSLSAESESAARELMPLLQDGLRRESPILLHFLLDQELP